jgi:predicted nuclease of predicted toxin-antitoxin system
MRFLIDDQLPPALARFIAAQGYDAYHVSDVGLTGADDRLIWEYATAQELVIVSKDEDFVFLRTLNREGPCVVWLRVGNARKLALIERIKTALPEIVQRLAEGERLIEVT